MKTTPSETITVRDDAALKSSTSAQYTVNRAAATQLVFTVAPTTVVHRVETAAFTVQRQDQDGNPTTTGTTQLTCQITVAMEDSAICKVTQ